MHLWDGHRGEGVVWEVAGHRMLVTAETETSNGCWKKHATAAVKRVVALEAKLARAKALCARLVGVVAQIKAVVRNAQEKLQDSRVCLDQVEKKAPLVTEKLEDLQKQSDRLAKAADDALKELDEEWKRKQLL